MASKRKTWAPVYPRRSKPQAPDTIKHILKEKADEIIENVLKPEYIKPPPTDNDLNYLVDIYSKWYRNYFYFCAKYNSPSPHAISPSFLPLSLWGRRCDSGRLLTLLRQTGLLSHHNMVADWWPLRLPYGANPQLQSRQPCSALYFFSSLPQLLKSGWRCRPSWRHWDHVCFYFFWQLYVLNVILHGSSW